MKEKKLSGLRATKRTTKKTSKNKKNKKKQTFSEVVGLILAIIGLLNLDIHEQFYIQIAFVCILFFVAVLLVVGFLKK